MYKLTQLLRKNSSIAKFLIVGSLATIVHATISWVFYYHIWCGFSIFSTLIGYAGGWIVSYTGNRLWSFRWHSKDAPVVSSAYKFIISQLISMCVLISTTWVMQQLIILYFWWYIITNHLEFTDELQQFSAGASYPPALFAGMFFAALCSYLVMRQFVFKPQS